MNKTTTSILPSGKKSRKRIFTFLKLAITTAIIYYLLSSGRLNLLHLRLLWETPLPFLMMLGIFFLIIIPMVSFRWWLILKATGIPIPLTRAIALCWIGNFFNTALPGAITGDVIKGFYLHKLHEDRGKTKAFMTILLDRITGLFGLIFMGAIALISRWDWVFSQPGMRPLALFILFLFIFALIFYGMILLSDSSEKALLQKAVLRFPENSIITKIFRTFLSYRDHKRILLGTLLMSLVIHCLVALIFFKISALLGSQDFQLQTQMIIMPFGLVTTAIPLAPGGIGIGHAAFETLYIMAGSKGGADVFNIYIVLQIASYLFGGIIYFFYSNEMDAEP